jgi:arsenate reductase
VEVGQQLVSFAANVDWAKQFKTFSNTQFQIANRIRTFLSLPVTSIDRLSLQNQLRQMGQERPE